MWANLVVWQILSTPLLAVPLTRSREPKFLRSFFEEKANSRQSSSIVEDLDVFMAALKDCALDLYSCLLLPLVRDPNDPYLLVALGTTIFSGNLIAQTALRKSQPIVVIEDPSRSNFLPILLDDPGRESGDIGDEVSILISSQGDAKGEVTFSGDTTSTRPTDISAVGQESASDGGGLELSRRTFDTTGEKQRSGSGKSGGGRGKHRKSEQETKYAKQKWRKGKRKITRKSYNVVNSSAGLAKNGKLDLGRNSTLVSPSANTNARSLKKSKEWNKLKADQDQFRDLNNVTINSPGQPLDDFPGCGSSQPGSQPWLGALYAVSLNPGNETDTFLVPVAILSATTKLQPNRPTIIVASGELIDAKIMNGSSGSVSSGDLATWGINLEARFDLENPSGPLVLPVRGVTWHPGFLGQDDEKELVTIEVEPGNLWDSDQVYPVCPPRSTLEYSAVAQVGWDIESSTLGAKRLREQTAGPLIMLTTGLEASGLDGEEHTTGGTHLSFSPGASKSPGWGSLILSTDPTTHCVSLVGFTRRAKGSVSRLSSCLLQWLAEIHDRTWTQFHICRPNISV